MKEFKILETTSAIKRAIINVIVSLLPLASHDTFSALNIKVIDQTSTGNDKA